MPLPQLNFNNLDPVGGFFDTAGKAQNMRMQAEKLAMLRDNIAREREKEERLSRAAQAFGPGMDPLAAAQQFAQAGDMNTARYLYGQAQAQAQAQAEAEKGRFAEQREAAQREKAVGFYARKFGVTPEHAALLCTIMVCLMTHGQGDRLKRAA